MKLATTFKKLASLEFWVDGLVVIAGSAGSSFVNALAQPMLAQVPVPMFVKNLTGPIVIMAASGLAGERHGKNLRIGAAVNVVDNALAALGVTA